MTNSSDRFEYLLDVGSLAVGAHSVSVRVQRSEGQSTLVALRDASDFLEVCTRDYVEHYRAAGYSWSEIAHDLGLTRRQVMYRFGVLS